MKICQVYSGNLYGGVETFFVTMARHRDLLPETHFALCFEGRLSEELLANGATVHLLGNVQTRRPWTVWRARRRFAELVRRENYDAVICNSSWPQAIFGPVARACRKRCVFWLHGPIVRKNWIDYWAQLTRPDLVVGVSRHTAGTSARLYNGAPLEVLHYPMPCAPPEDDGVDRAAVRAEFGTPAEATVIMQASRMDAWKGQPDLLTALARLRGQPGWACWQVGGAQRRSEVRYFENLKRQTAALGIADRVQFLGQRADVPRLLRAADIYSQSNRGPEGFSLAFLEAFSAGLPIVTTNIGGAAELIDDSCGRLVPVGDTKALAEALRTLIVDRELLAELGQNARQRVRTLTSPSQQFGLFRQILARR